MPVCGPTGVYSVSRFPEPTPTAGSMPCAWLVEPQQDPLAYLQEHSALREKAESAFHRRANRYGHFIDAEVYATNACLLDLPLPHRFLQCAMLATGASLAYDPELLAIRSNLLDHAKTIAMPALSSSPRIEVL